MTDQYQIGLIVVMINLRYRDNKSKFDQKIEMRYGENPHQKAGLFTNINQQSKSE